MSNVRCPKCRGSVDVRTGIRAGRGQTRMTCGCGHRFVVKVTQKQLRLERDAEVEDKTEAVKYAVVIQQLDHGQDLLDLYTLLLKMPQFGPGGSSVDEVGVRLPYPIVGLTEDQARVIEAELRKLVCLCLVGPEREVLVGPLRSFRSS